MLHSPSQEQQQQQQQQTPLRTEISSEFGPAGGWRYRSHEVTRLILLRLDRDCAEFT